jgi:hypothetical protein
MTLRRKEAEMTKILKSYLEKGMKGAGAGQKEP